MSDLNEIKLRIWFESILAAFCQKAGLFDRIYQTSFVIDDSAPDVQNTQSIVKTHRSPDTFFFLTTLKVYMQTISSVLGGYRRYRGKFTDLQKKGKRNLRAVSYTHLRAHET